MKATKILMSLLALIVFAGCSTETIDENTQNLETFTVIASHIDEATAARMWVDSETRATISADDKNMWESNDKLAFAPAGGTQCTLTATSVSSDGKTATFEGEGASFPGVTTFYAAYPSTAAIAADGTATYSIASTQDGSAASAMLLYGEGVRTSNTEIEISFVPVAAILHVTTGDAMDRIVVESCNGENIAGTFTSAGVFSGSGSAITIDPAGSANDFYVALPAATLAKGYKIRYYKDAGSDAQMLYSYNYNNGTSFEAGKGYKVNFTREWSPVSVTLGARSSYSFYEDGKITEANACNAETIYFSNTTVNGVALNCASSFSGISSTMVSECGFIIDNIETPATYDSATKTFSIANKSGLTWGTNKMTVSAYIKHNGNIIAQSAPRTMHITGLPYNQTNFYGVTSMPSGWTITGDYSWSSYWWGTSGDGNNYLRMKGANESSRAYVLSPEFQIPSSLNISTITDYYFYSSTTGQTGSICIKASGKNVDRNMPSSSTYSTKSTISFNAFGDYSDLKYVLTLTPNTPHVAITHNVSKPSVGCRFMGLKSINIVYQ